MIGLLLLFSMAAFGIFRFLQLKRQSALERERLTHQMDLQQLNFEQKERTRLEEMDAFQSRFFANISHELRTPLKLILNPIHRLLKSKNWNAKERMQLQLIEDNAHQLLTRVNEILDLTKFDAQQMVLHETPTTFYHFTKRLAANFENFAQQKAQQLVFDYQLKKDLTILLDQGKFTHVFNNYVANAIKYTPESGKVTIRCYEKKDAAPTLVLAVKDNGIGIRADDLPQLFERFYQADQAENKAGGSGIGLALSKEVAQAMQARVWAESKWGKGSTFFFEFSYQEVLGAFASVVARVSTNRVAALKPRLTPSTAELGPRTLRYSPKVGQKSVIYKVLKRVKNALL
ncbi:MAG: ATP-binding protein [Bacteroidota bacterium]